MSSKRRIDVYTEENIRNVIASGTTILRTIGIDCRHCGSGASGVWCLDNNTKDTHWHDDVCDACLPDDLAVLLALQPPSINEQ